MAFIVGDRTIHESTNALLDIDRETQEQAADAGRGVEKLHRLFPSKRRNRLLPFAVLAVGEMRGWA